MDKHREPVLVALPQLIEAVAKLWLYVRMVRVFVCIALAQYVQQVCVICAAGVRVRNHIAKAGILSTTQTHRAI